MTGCKMREKRTPEEILQHHAKAVREGDLDAIAADYTNQSVLITAQRKYCGSDEIRYLFSELITALPKAQWSATRVFEDDVLFVQWTARSTRYIVTDGADTFIFRDGMIRIQTVHATFARVSFAP